jgi:hypothetical protein
MFQRGSKYLSYGGFGTVFPWGKESFNLLLIGRGYFCGGKGTYSICRFDRRYFHGEMLFQCLHDREG